MAESMSRRDIQAKGNEISERATDAIGDPEQGRFAINDPEVAAVMAEWDKSSIEGDEEKLAMIRDGRDSELTIRMQRAIANPIKRELVISYLEDRVARSKSTTDSHELGFQVPGATAQVVMGRELKPVASEEDLAILENSRLKPRE
jgi:hypothetical protein